jgi:hypothetical protein
MVVSVVVCLRNISISRLDGFRMKRKSRIKEIYTSVIFVCGVELYVCVHLVNVCVDVVMVSSFGVRYY